MKAVSLKIVIDIGNFFVAAIVGFEQMLSPFGHVCIFDLLQHGKQYFCFPLHSLDVELMRAHRCGTDTDFFAQFAGILFEVYSFHDVLLRFR